MKAVLKLCVNGVNSNTSYDLERMSLYDLDCLLMKNYADSDALKNSEDYYFDIQSFLGNIANRENLQQPNGSIRIFLENDNGEPIMETRSFRGEPHQRIQKQIRVLYNKHWKMFHKSDMESGKCDFSKLRELAIAYYKDNPEEFRELLKSCYRVLRNEHFYGDYGLNTFMNYYRFEDVQETMLGDTKSLFDSKPIHITQKRKYDRQVKEFINGLSFKNMGDAYLNIREAGSSMIDKLELKPEKTIKTKPPVKPETLDDLMRQKFHKAYKGKYSDDVIEAMCNDYWNYQPEEQKAKRYNRI